MEGLEVFIAYAEAGIVSGSIYSLIGIGMNLLVVVSRIFQFAYGEIVVISMYMCWLIYQVTGSFLLGLIAAGAMSVILTMLVEPLLRGLREKRLLTETFIITIAVGLMLTEIMSQYLNAGLPVAFPKTIVGGGWDLSFGLIRVSGADVYVVAASVFFMAGLLFFLFRTRQGRALRAIAHNIQAARLIGIPLRRCVFLSFTIAGLLSGLTAALYILTMGVATPTLGQYITFKGMAVVMIGGMGSLKGAVVGGYLLGLTECMVRGYFIGDWVDAIAMGFIMVMIFVKPAGLFGAAREY
jgi:branched-chain amino acid transport system permease protein